jgi:large subunit ribosomal protein L24
MQKFHVKRGDQVVVIAGSHKGKSGKVLEVLAAKSRARVEGVAMIKRHLKVSQTGQRKEGGIVEREGSVHLSNLMSQANFDASKRRKAAPAASAPSA